MLGNADQHPTPAASARRRTGVRFVAFFALGVLAFYAFTATAFHQTTIFPAILRLNAAAAGAVLNAMGQGVAVHGADVGDLRVARGCDGTEPAAVLAAALLAIPAPLRRRLAAVGLALVGLFLLNVLRIVTLHFAKVHLSDDAFRLIHAEVWQGLFVLACVGGWLAAASWIRPRTPTPPPDAAAPEDGA